MAHDITIAILAGGRSRRMGTDKALLERNGSTLLEHVVSVSVATGLPVIIVGREAPANWNYLEVSFVPDSSPDIGPLGGLLSALQYVPGDVLAIPCDLPNLTTDAVNWLLAQRASRELEHGLVAENNGNLEPLFSVYTKESVSLVESRIAAKKLSLHGLILQGKFQYAEIPSEIGAALRNVNTPEDWERL